MKLLKYTRKEDFGIEHAFHVLCFKNYALLQIFVGWDDYSSWPYFQFSSGHGRVFDILFYVHKFSMNIVFPGRSITLDDYN